MLQSVARGGLLPRRKQRILSNTYSFHRLAGLDGSALEFEGYVENETNDPGLLFELGDNA